MKNTEPPFRIEKKGSFRVVGYGVRTSNQRGQGRTVIPRHWSSIKADGYEKALWPRANKEPHGLFGINIYNTDTTDPRIFDYLIAVSSDTEADGEFTSYEVPARTWAVFPCTLETIGKTEAQAITKWLPKFQYNPLNRGYITGRMKSNAPDIEYYGENGLVEVWIAVEKK